MNTAPWTVQVLRGAATSNLAREKKAPRSSKEARDSTRHFLSQPD